MERNLAYYKGRRIDCLEMLQIWQQRNRTTKTTTGQRICATMITESRNSAALAQQRIEQIERKVLCPS